jgi:hypothetical protein
MLCVDHFIVPDASSEHVIQAVQHYTGGFFVSTLVVGRLFGPKLSFSGFSLALGSGGFACPPLLFKLTALTLAGRFDANLLRAGSLTASLLGLSLGGYSRALLGQVLPRTGHRCCIRTCTAVPGRAWEVLSVSARGNGKRQRASAPQRSRHHSLTFHRLHSPGYFKVA